MPIEKGGEILGKCRDARCELVRAGLDLYEGVERFEQGLYELSVEPPTRSTHSQPWNIIKLLFIIKLRIKK